MRFSCTSRSSPLMADRVRRWKLFDFPWSREILHLVYNGIFKYSESAVPPPSEKRPMEIFWWHFGTMWAWVSRAHRRIELHPLEVHACLHSLMFHKLNYKSGKRGNVAATPLNIYQLNATYFSLVDRGFGMSLAWRTVINGCLKKLNIARLFDTVLKFYTFL